MNCGSFIKAHVHLAQNGVSRRQGEGIVRGILNLIRIKKTKKWGGCASQGCRRLQFQRGKGRKWVFKKEGRRKERKRKHMFYQGRTKLPVSSLEHCQLRREVRTNFQSRLKRRECSLSGKEPVQNATAEQQKEKDAATD